MPEALKKPDKQESSAGTPEVPEVKPAAPEAPKMYGPWVSVFVTLFLYFAAQLLAAAVIYSIPAANKWAHEKQEAWLQNPWVMFSYIALAEAIILGVIYKLLSKRKLSFRTIGLNKPKAAFIGYALGAYALYFVIYLVSLVVAKAVLPGLNLEQKQELGFDQTTTGLSLLPIFISLVILPPITEEIIMRGFLFTGLRTKLPFISAAIVTSLMFAAAHLGEGGGGGLLWVAGIDTFILSLVLCYLREKTGSLWPGIGVHMLKNLVAFVVLYNIFSYIR